jgi:hypothetical protein
MALRPTQGDEKRRLSSNRSLWERPSHPDMRFLSLPRALTHPSKALNGHGSVPLVQSVFPERHQATTLYMRGCGGGGSALRVKQRLRISIAACARASCST